MSAANSNLANSSLVNSNEAGASAADVVVDDSVVAPNAEARLLYFTDPMCSWCWGFSPEVAKLQRHYGESLPIEVIAGGLRGPETPPMNFELRNKIHSHWRQVERLTGQPFEFIGSLPEGFVYNSEPACRALVAGRRLAPKRALLWLQALQQAFYAQAVDITQTGHLRRLARDFGLIGFADVFDCAQTREITAADFDRRYESAVTGFPSLLLQRGERLKLVSQGYAKADEITERLDKLLS